MNPEYKLYEPISPFLFIAINPTCISFKSLLEFLFQQIEIIFPGYSGFYVGGMKQKDLQISESKKVVLATYAMAEEALDIKTLTTLIMATPKTDITQSVGRILRMKHDNPIVVDIIDSHDCFQNQWKQRKRYYKKCNYLIKHICTCVPCLAHKFKR